MASRRMFSLKIIDSAKFLKMPSSSRLLYFDLCMRADDDGVVEGFNVLRMTGATEDDLRILTAKGFITVLNDDLVAYIQDWTEHNKIRADRKINSIYKDLLLQVLPDIKLIEPRKRADSKVKNYRTDNGQSKDGLGKDRLGKDRLGKDRLEEVMIEPTSSTPILSFPSDIHKLIYVQFGEVTYQTWFKDSRIDISDTSINIKVNSILKKQIIEEKYLKNIEIIAGKEVIVDHE